MNPLAQRIEALEKALAAKSAGTSKPQFVPINFPAQAALLNDPSRQKVVLCTRRAGKSHGVTLALFKDAWETPGCSCLYLALTRESAKRILVKDVIQPINKQLKLNADYNKSELSFTLSNGSVIYLLGADADEKEKEKILGQKFKAVVVDEAASYSIDLVDLIYSKLMPALADLQGTIYLTGTPGNIKSGLFFELTKDQDPCSPGTWDAQATVNEVTYKGWSGHRWSAFENPYMQWQKEIDEKILNSPGIQNTPLFEQDYYGRWVIDESKLVYRFLKGRNTYTKLPLHPHGHWHSAMAVDLGYEDPTGLLIVQWHDNDQCLYVTDEYEKQHLDITSTAEVIQSYDSLYPALERKVIDGASKQSVEELRKRHNLDLLAADKRDKFEFINMLNSEFIQGKVKISESCLTLIKELSELILNPKSIVPKEHPALPNHLCDCLLYSWRMAYPYLSQPITPPKFKPGSDSDLNEQQRLADQQAELAMNSTISERQRDGGEFQPDQDPESYYNQ